MASISLGLNELTNIDEMIVTREGDHALIVS